MPYILVEGLIFRFGFGFKKYMIPFQFRFQEMRDSVSQMHDSISVSVSVLRNIQNFRFNCKSILGLFVIVHTTDWPKNTARRLCETLHFEKVRQKVVIFKALRGESGWIDAQNLLVDCQQYLRVFQKKFA